MTWQVHCKVFGTGDVVRWFVAREYDGNVEFVNNERGRPLPYTSEQDAAEKAAQLNDVWGQFDVRR